MTENNKNLTGKELAKLNKRKKFYTRFENLCKRQNLENEVISLSLDKRTSFPEYDDLALIFQENCSESQERFNIEEGHSLALPYLDDARFLVTVCKKNLLSIVKQETDKDDSGQQRKSSESAENDDGYTYQSAFNYGIVVSDKSELVKLLEKEKDAPTQYQVEVKTEKRLGLRKRYRKNRKPRRRRP